MSNFPAVPTENLHEKDNTDVKNNHFPQTRTAFRHQEHGIGVLGDLRRESKVTKKRKEKIKNRKKKAGKNDKNTSEDPSDSWDEFLRVILLFLKVFRERSNTSDDANSHEQNRDQGPNHAPAARGATIPLSEDAGIRCVHFSDD